MNFLLFSRHLTLPLFCAALIALSLLGAAPAFGEAAGPGAAPAAQPLTPAERAGAAITPAPAPAFVPPAWTALPFAAMLLTLAVFPLVAAQHWERVQAPASLLWAALALGLMWASLPAGTGFAAVYGGKTVATLEDYVAFIVLLGTLYVLSGGIYFTGGVPGTPGRNVAMLLLGSVLANLVGTTGAAMLLVRPLIRDNLARKRQTHVIVFLIFIVCNVAGLLTPIGDPPLFLGYLQGIPFFWTLKLWPQWAFTVGVLLLVFYGFDKWLAHRDGLPAQQPAERLELHGWSNLLLLAGVIGAVILSGSVHTGVSFSLFGLHEVRLESLLRDAVLVGLALVSLRFTSRHARTQNGFSFAPLREVAVLFFGIFVTMAPALMLMQQRGAELGLGSPASYFWFSGILSSFLDNAPTYMTFLAAAQGTLGASHAIELTRSAAGESVLAALSAGSVFMGANTYIGNGPNFMVKAIAERSGVPMPGFFGYMVWSCAILLPLFGLVTWLFFA
jgi:Na+/H+ antiporter NhaD/arsenite permease-like protein